MRTAALIDAVRYSSDGRIAHVHTDDDEPAHTVSRDVLSDWVR